MDKVMFSTDALSDLMYWAHNDRKILDKIYSLIKDIKRNGPAKGLGKPERLKHKDAWSRRIDETNRLVCSIIEGDIIYVDSCRDHYGD